MNLKETEPEVMEWLESGGSRYCRLTSVVNLHVPVKAVNFFTSWPTVSFFRWNYVIYGYKLTKVAGGKVMYVVASFNILNPTYAIRT
jgi:hypothetical protein